MARKLRFPIHALVLMCLAFASPAWARTVYTTFNYQFDEGGEIAGFYSNLADQGGKVAWKPGGAMESLGSLRASGPVASFERFDHFKPEDGATLSFHYFMHGYTDLQVRLNLANKESAAAFDSAAVQRERDCAQDQWVFVQIPIESLPGLRKRDRTAPAGLTYKSLTFIAEARDGSRGLAAPAERYILIDNVRIGPPIQESDINIRQRGGHSTGTKQRVLIDPSASGAEDMVVDGDDVKTASATTPTGKPAIKLTAAPGKRWAAFEFAPEAIGDWGGFEFLVLDLYTDEPSLVPIVVELWDDQTKNYRTRCTFQDRFALPPVHRGNTRVLVDLRLARRNSKEGLSFNQLTDADKPNLSTLKKVKVWFTTTDLDKDYVVYLERAAVLQEGALDSNMDIELPEGAIAYDFGENSPLVKGFTEVNLLDIYSEDQPYGFMSAAGLRAEGTDWPDALTGDYVGGGHDDAGHWREASFEFRADVPNGRYLVWANVTALPYPNLYIDANVNGKLVFSGSLDASTFYTKSWFYRFFDTNYSEKPSALWKNYVAKVAPAHILETEVRNGTFFIKGQNSMLGACILVPVAEREAFDKLVAQIEKERIRYFYRNLYLERPENEPSRIADADAVLFAPAEGTKIKPWSGVGADDTQAVDLTAARGEAIAFQVALRPFRDLGTVSVSISNLRGPDGATIPSDAISVFFKKYLSDGMRIHDWCLMPENQVEIEKDLTRAFWFRLRVPADAAKGTYRGTVTANAGDVQRQIPVTIEVFPFTLRDNLPLAAGFYYQAPDTGQFTAYDQVDDFAAQRDRILREQAEILHDFGMTSSEVPSPPVKALRGSGVVIDVTPTEKVCRALQDAGMLANDRQMAMPYMLTMARRIGALLKRAGESGRNETEMPGFPTAYYSAVQQTVNWARDHGVPMILWVVDEPRETPNPWNRNFADTVTHLDIIKDIPNAIRMSTPMADSSGPVDYVPLLDHLEVVATHPTPHSKKIISRAMSDPNIGLWVYNAGKDRMSNGFYIWRVGATGKFEWHFSMWLYEKDRKGYMGIDVHNPFLNYEYNGAFVPAPLAYKGAVLPTESVMTMSTGINDYRYLYTLESAIAAQGDASSPAVKKARKLLDELRESIPVLPKTKGYEKAENLAEVGQGLADDQRLMLNTWRRQVAECIADLQQP